MKKIIPLFLIVAVLVGTGVTMAKADKGKDYTFFIDKGTDTKNLKELINVRHETDEFISGSIHEDDLEEAIALSVQAEEVGIYTIQKFDELEEEVIEPGRSQNSRKKDERLCVPPMQIGYNVEQSNGGDTQDGGGVKIAILDTGALTTHPDLDVFVCKDATQGGILNGCEDDFGSLGHGTFTLGVASANGGKDKLGMYGMAPRSQAWMLKVCDASGSCRWDDIARAIDYAADHGANIISMSFGGSAPSQVVKDAIQAHPEVLFVASTGNTGGYDTILFPAAMPEVVAVGGLWDDKTYVYFASQGRNDGDFIVEEREVEFAAGAVGVLATSSNGCYAFPNGTSFSTPGVAGLAAKVWHEGGNSATEVREYMHTITEDLEEPGDDPKTGFGLPVAP